MNVQNATLERGSLEIVNREDDIKNLGLVEKEIVREVELLQTLKPKVTALKESLQTAEHELGETRCRVVELSAIMENSSDQARCRYLRGYDPEQKELSLRILQLEGLLADKEVTSLV